mgnify:CR=1 FL=1
MKKSILTIICFIGLSFCQIEHGGVPKFFNERSLDINSIVINQEQVIDRNFDPMVFIYGYEYDVDIDISGINQYKIPPIKVRYKNGIVRNFRYYRNGPRRKGSKRLAEKYW